MAQDPTIIQLDVRHFHDLLKLHCPAETRVRVMECLAEAQAPRHAAPAEPRSAQANDQDGSTGDAEILRDKARQCFRLARSITNRNDTEALEGLGREMDEKALAIERAQAASGKASTHN